MHFYRLIPTFSEGEGGVQFVMHPEKLLAANFGKVEIHDYL